MSMLAVCPLMRGQVEFCSHPDTCNEVTVVGPGARGVIGWLLCEWCFEKPKQAFYWLDCILDWLLRR